MALKLGIVTHELEKNDNAGLSKYRERQVISTEHVLKTYPYDIGGDLSR